MYKYYKCIHQYQNDKKARMRKKKKKLKRGKKKQSKSFTCYCSQKWKILNLKPFGFLFRTGM